MRKVLAILSLVLLFTYSSSCLLLDPIGLTYPNRIKGSQASDKIINAAIIADIVNANINSVAGNGLILSILADRIAGINSSGYYVESEVEDCVDTINGVMGYVIGSTFTILLQSKCNLTEDKSIMDSPFPEL